VKINISNLPQGTHEYELSKGAEDLGLEQNFIGDVAAKVTLEKSSRQMLLRAGVTSHANFQCDRCLDEFKRHITPTFQTVYVWNHDDRTDDDDVRVLAMDMNIIDISDDVRDSVVLAVPLKLLCKEECAGLCPRCGRNLNHTADGKCDCPPKEVDPRWNKLSGLVEVSIMTKKN
jgi:uncharacterized protein